MEEENISSVIQQAKVAYMSNAKWRKFFKACESCTSPIEGVEWKFVWSKNSFARSIYVSNALINESMFGDCPPSPYAQLREIDWILIPQLYKDPRSDSKRPLPQQTNDIDKILEHIKKYGQFPIFHTDNGFKILGYKW